MSEYGADQLTAGIRSMHMLAGLVDRGGHPAAVSPTIPLRTGEKQYGWFPVRMDAAERRIAVITNQRLIIGEEIPLASITRITPIAGECSVALRVRGREQPVVLGGPWVPWMGVVICAELYGSARPPARTVVPVPRRRPSWLACHRAG